MNSGNCVFQLDSSARVILRTTGLTATPDFVQALSAVITWSAETAAPALAAAVAVRPATLAPTVKSVSACLYLHTGFCIIFAVHAVFGRFLL